MIDCTILPKEIGAYNVMVYGVFSAMPLYWDFDGTKWAFADGVELKPGEAWYFDHVYPLGYGNNYEPPAPPSNDLQSRLARFKEKKNAG